jgi:hypothetical protein
MWTSCAGGSRCALPQCQLPLCSLPTLYSHLRINAQESAGELRLELGRAECYTRPLLDSLPSLALLGWILLGALTPPPSKHSSHARMPLHLKRAAQSGPQRLSAQGRGGLRLKLPFPLPTDGSLGGPARLKKLLQHEPWASKGKPENSAAVASRPFHVITALTGSQQVNALTAFGT